jgi:hypothetical protein
VSHGHQPTSVSRTCMYAGPHTHAAAPVSHGHQPTSVSRTCMYAGPHTHAAAPVSHGHQPTSVSQTCMYAGPHTHAAAHVSHLHQPTSVSQTCMYAGPHPLQEVQYGGDSCAVDTELVLQLKDLPVNMHTVSDVLRLYLVRTECVLMPPYHRPLAQKTATTATAATNRH